MYLENWKNCSIKLHLWSLKYSTIFWNTHRPLSLDSSLKYPSSSTQEQLPKPTTLACSPFLNTAHSCYNFKIWISWPYCSLQLGSVHFIRVFSFPMRQPAKLEIWHPKCTKTPNANSFALTLQLHKNQDVLSNNQIFFMTPKWVYLFLHSPG